MAEELRLALRKVSEGQQFVHSLQPLICWGRACIGRAACWCPHQLQTLVLMRVPP